VPPDAGGYWIKVSDRTVVPWLGFDRTTRQYTFDPATYVPFFAAENVVGEPAPGLPGTQQTMVVSGLDPATTFDFAARVLIAAADASAIFADGFESGGTAAWSAVSGAP
jgi:hypothetical protein